MFSNVITIQMEKTIRIKRDEMLISGDNTSPYQTPGVFLVAAAAGGSFTFNFFRLFF